MNTLITVLLIIASILLILIVLVQNSKGGGLVSNFSSSNQIMGVRKTADFLEKATWTLAIAVLILSIAGSLTIPRANTEDEGSAIEEQVQNASDMPVVPTVPVAGEQNMEEGSETE
jgi:preprotein translocase subunit SecG